MFAPGQIVTLTFPRFTARLTFRAGKELHLEVITGDNAGFSDSVAYEEQALRDGFATLSWREHIGTTVVHVIDVRAAKTSSFITTAKGEFMRQTGDVTGLLEGEDQ